MVAERRADREGHVAEAADVLLRELEKVDIPVDISGRAKHFYSIYDKMARKGREFNEIYDLTAMRVIVERDGRGGDARLLRRARPDPLALEADARPLQGLRRDAEVQRLPLLHTTVIGPEGRPLEIQVRTREMQETAELGVAAHWAYKGDGAARGSAPTRSGTPGCGSSWTSTPTRPTRASSSRASAPTSSTRRCSSSHRRAR